MKTLIIATGLLLTTSSIYAQTEVLQGVMQGKDYGVVYSLPKTEIEIEIKANKITYKPGEFSKYAERFLRMPNVSNDAEEYWEITEITAKGIGTPNSEATYFVKLKDKTVAPLMELTEDGIVKSINVPYTPAKTSPATPAQPAGETQKKVNPRDFLTEEILIAGSTAKMAELVAKEIYNIRESKNALLRGQADNMPTDGTQMKIMIDNLNIQETAMTEMFTGTREKKEKTFTFRITPDKELFRFHPKKRTEKRKKTSRKVLLIMCPDRHYSPLPMATRKYTRKKLQLPNLEQQNIWLQYCSTKILPLKSILIRQQEAYSK